MTDLITRAARYAMECHEATNCLYDGKPFSEHLKMVYAYGLEYAYLLPEEDQEFALAACHTHDVIEDCRKTYNDVKAVLGERIADLTYALTNEKGKNRTQRENFKYFEGIRDIPGAVFVKICDRLANVKYSKETKSPMLDVYRKEYSRFHSELYFDKYIDMFRELEKLLFDV